MMQHFFVPTWSGDFRLLRTGPTTCQLSVEDPTPGELVALGRLVTAAAANGWAEGGIVIAERGVTEVELAVSIEFAGPLVSGTVHGDASVWTAVRHESGKVIVVSESTTMDEDEAAEAEIDDALDAADLVDADADPSDHRLAAAAQRNRAPGRSRRRCEVWRFHPTARGRVQGHEGGQENVDAAGRAYAIP